MVENKLGALWLLPIIDEITYVSAVHSFHVRDDDVMISPCHHVSIICSQSSLISTSETDTMMLRAALLLIVSLVSSDAFSTTCSFTRRSLPPAPKCHQSTPSYRSSIQRSALSMNLFDRFTRVAKSNINNVLKSLEDPEKIMNQALEDMQVIKKALLTIHHVTH